MLRVDKVVAPRVFQVFKNETVKFKSVEVAPSREQIRREVQLELDRQLEDFWIDVVDVLINDLEFPQAFTCAGRAAASGPDGDTLPG